MLLVLPNLILVISTSYNIYLYKRNEVLHLLAKDWFLIGRLDWFDRLFVLDFYQKYLEDVRGLKYPPVAESLPSRRRSLSNLGFFSLGLATAILFFAICLTMSQS